MKHFFLPIILMTLSVLILPAMSIEQGYVANQTYWGRNKYIEYGVGELPIIISAPHGGYLKPSEIPNRSWGVSGIDSKSQEYARQVADYIQQMIGARPHLIINHLHRSKLDANRAIEEAAQGNRWAEKAWTEFHGFIDQAAATVKNRCGKGLYLDFHTNAHSQQWTELGLGLTSSDLKLSNNALNIDKYKKKSTIRSLAFTQGVSFPGVVRGQMSLGGLLQAAGYKSVPSPKYPRPNSSAYFYTGYNSLKHGSRSGGTIDGIQVETYYKFVNSDSSRNNYSRALASALVDIYKTYYKCSNISSPGPQPYRTYLPLLMRRS